MIFRLAPNDYHRFHFPCDGFIGSRNKITGYYYSVSPSAVKENISIFWKNIREYSLLSSEEYSDIIISEVGATMVGSIVQTHKSISKVKKGLEKGYFEFGGSTVVLILKKDAIIIDDDLIENTKDGLETFVRMGEKIAVH